MPDATLETAAELHRRGDVDEAARQCERVLLSQPDNAIAQNMMGVLRGLQGRLDDAAAAFARAVALQPRTAEHHRNLALTLSRQGHHGAAAESFHRAATLRPSAAALGEIGRAHV